MYRRLEKNCSVIKVNFRVVLFFFLPAFYGRIGPSCVLLALISRPHLCILRALYEFALSTCIEFPICLSRLTLFYPNFIGAKVTFGVVPYILTQICINEYFFIHVYMSLILSDAWMHVRKCKL